MPFKREGEENRMSAKNKSKVLVLIITLEEAAAAAAAKKVNLTSRLCLPVSIDNGDFRFPNFFVIPEIEKQTNTKKLVESPVFLFKVRIISISRLDSPTPCFRIDGFSNRTKYFETTQIIFR